MFPQQSPQGPFPNMTPYSFPTGYPHAMYNGWAQQHQMMQMMYPNNPYLYNMPSKSDAVPTTPQEECQMQKKYEALIKDKAERKMKFDEVSGRLCLLNTCKKYVVTVGEICRRMSAPETLHTSLLNGILRNAKAKDNGVKLRSKLQHFKVQLPQGRRKTCKTTGFTALCEEETAELAKDLGRLLTFQGAANEIGEFLFESESTGCHLISELVVFHRWIAKLVAMHPETSDPDDIEPINEAEQAINHLSLLTHGFSHVAIPLVLKFALAITEDMKNPSEKNPTNVPSQPPAAPAISPNGQMNMFATTQNASTSSSQMLYPMSPYFPNAVFNPYANLPPPWAQQQMAPGMPYKDLNQSVQKTPQQPENAKLYTPLLHNEQDRLEKFDEVSARLQLLSASRKYSVSTGEVCRRMASPEMLHSSLLNGILRNAKGKDNGTKLRSKLSNFDVQLPQGRRKTCQITKFTAFCEQEAESLAKDFRSLLLDNTHGGAVEIGAYLVETMAGDCFQSEVEITKKWLKKIIAQHPVATPEEFKATNKAERAAHHLSLITHGFSHIAIPAVLEYALKIIDAAVQTNLDRRQIAQQMPPTMMMAPTNPMFLQ